MHRIWVALCGALVAASCAGAPDPPPYLAVADVKQLMNSLIDPQADEIWDNSGWIITQSGIEERKPKNDEEWLAVMNHAIAVTEAGNLLMMAPRARDGDLWMKYSRELTEAGQKVWRAAQAKDVQQLFDTGGLLYESCLNCHGEYIDAIKNVNVK
jgi:hypothetical protein